MIFIARIIRFLFWVLIVSWGIRLAGRVFSKLLQPGQPSTPTHAESEASSNQSRQLVRDPVCGVHIDEALSIPLREDDPSVHFCSIACRDQYVSNSRKLAANA